MSIVKVILLAALLGAPVKQQDKVPPLTIQFNGYLSAYNEQPTLGTIEYRRSAGDIPDDKSYYVATIGCDYIGWRGRLKSGSIDVPVIVFDCAGADGAFDWFSSNNIIAEVGYYLWQAHPELVGAYAELVIRPSDR